MPGINQPVIEEVREWVSRKFDDMTSTELEEYHIYYSSPLKGDHPQNATKPAMRHASSSEKGSEAADKNRTISPGDPAVTKKIDHGSSDVIVKLYFNLLKQANPAYPSGEPFVSPGKVNFLVKNYLGVEIGEPIDQNAHYTIDRPELIYFVENYCGDLQVKHTNSKLTKKQIVEIVIREFPDLFEGTVESYYKNWSKLASKVNHKLLDWSKHEAIVTHVNYYK